MYLNQYIYTLQADVSTLLLRSYHTHNLSLRMVYKCISLPVALNLANQTGKTILEWLSHLFSSKAA